MHLDPRGSRRDRRMMSTKEVTPAGPCPASAISPEGVFRPLNPSQECRMVVVGSAVVPRGLLRVFPVILQEVALGRSPMQLCPPQYPQSRF